MFQSLRGRELTSMSLPMSRMQPFSPTTTNAVGRLPQTTYPLQSCCKPDVHSTPQSRSGHAAKA
jgi:hypothetical protein